MTLKARLTALDADLKAYIDLRERSLEAAKQADLAAVRVEAQIALVRELMEKKPRG